MVGSDLEHQVNNPHHAISLRSGFDVKALTYCELKSIEIESLMEVKVYMRVRMETGNIVSDFPAVP